MINVVLQNKKFYYTGKCLQVLADSVCVLLCSLICASALQAGSIPGGNKDFAPIISKVSFLKNF